MENRNTPLGGVSAFEGWYTLDRGKPFLLGTRCRSCGTFYFPPQAFYCRNPSCDGEDFEKVPLSSCGTLWSFTEQHYPPPAPYVASEPFVPYIVAAVELTKEKMIILGQVAKGISAKGLRIGMDMEARLETLFQDERGEHLVWKWQPKEAP